VDVPAALPHREAMPRRHSGRPVRRPRRADRPGARRTPTRKRWSVDTSTPPLGL